MAKGSHEPKPTPIEMPPPRVPTPQELADKRRGQEAAALDAAGAALGALGMLAFAAVFWWLVESSVVGAFAGASLAWLVVSVAAWLLRRKMRNTRRARLGEKISGSAISRSRYG